MKAVHTDITNSKVTIEEAQNRLTEMSMEVGVQKRRIWDCLGLVLAEDIAAVITQPPFARSAMDGYAVRAEDVSFATQEASVILPVVAEIYAGDQPPQKLLPGEAMRIMTGAPIPEGADLVIPQEMTDYGGREVTFYRGGKAGENCCPAGEDFSKGDILARKGEAVDAYTIAAAVAGGVKMAAVRKRIRAAVITTGNELVSMDEKTDEKNLPIGKIYNSSLAYFVSRLTELGCDVISAVTVPDDTEVISETIRTAASEADLILTTGGVSVGGKDYLPEVINDLGAENIFRGIRIKPGMPTMAARYQNSTILCLSGNPYSAIAMFEVLFPAYEQKALGRNRMRIRRYQSVTINSFTKASPNRRLVRGILQDDGVWIPKDQRNGQLLAGVGSNCLVDIPAGSGPLTVGVTVELYTLS